MLKRDHNSYIVESSCHQQAPAKKAWELLLEFPQHDGLMFALQCPALYISVRFSLAVYKVHVLPNSNMSCYTENYRITTDLGESKQLWLVFWILSRFACEKIYLLYLSPEAKFCFHLYFNNLRHSLKKMKFQNLALMIIHKQIKNTKHPDDKIKSVESVLQVVT